MDLLQQFNPVRSPSGRLNRVMDLLESRPVPRRPSRVSDDRYVAGYYNLLLRNRTTDWRRFDAAASGEDPAVVCADQLRWSPDVESRAILEARILTGQSDAEIVARMLLAAEAVEWYEALFFCVRDRLQCSDWIKKTIQDMCGPPLLYGFEELADHHRHTAYRSIGYYGGPVLLEKTIRLSPRWEPLQPDECDPYLDDVFRAKVRLAAMLEVAYFNKRNVHLLFVPILRSCGRMPWKGIPGTT